MSKRIMDKPGTMLYPVPAVLVSCGDGSRDNILTVAWTGIVNSEPPILYISVRKSRFSHELISKTGEFVVNLTTEEMAWNTDFCGVKSGRDIDKFQATAFTRETGVHVNCPMIAEAPVSIECKVRETLEFPSHDMFIADVVAVHGREELFDERGKFDLEKAGLICFSHGGYFGLKRTAIGRFGYSVMKPRTKKRLKKTLIARSD